MIMDRGDRGNRFGVVIFLRCGRRGRGRILFLVREEFFPERDKGGDDDDQERHEDENDDHAHSGKDTGGCDP